MFLNHINKMEEDAIVNGVNNLLVVESSDRFDLIMGRRFICSDIDNCNSDQQYIIYLIKTNDNIVVFKHPKITSYVGSISELLFEVGEYNDNGLNIQSLNLNRESKKDASVSISKIRNIDNDMVRLYNLNRYQDGKDNSNNIEFILKKNSSYIYVIVSLQDESKTSVLFTWSEYTDKEFKQGGIKWKK